MVLLAHKVTAKIDRFDYHVLFLALLFNFPPKKAMGSNKRTFSTRHPSLWYLISDGKLDKLNL